MWRQLGRTLLSVTVNCAKGVLPEYRQRLSYVRFLIVRRRRMFRLVCRIVQYRRATLYNTHNECHQLEEYFFRMFNFVSRGSQQDGLKGSLSKLLNNCCAMVNRARLVFVDFFL